jgi:hypothetical protein
MVINFGLFQPQYMSKAADFSAASSLITVIKYFFRYAMPNSAFISIISDSSFASHSASVGA